MKRALLLLVVFAAGLTVATFAQKKPTVSIDAGLALYRIDGSRVSGQTAKRLTLMRLKYNDATIPCVVMDASESTLSNAVMPPSISCAWTPQIVDAVNRD